MNVDGKQIAADIYAALLKRRTRLSRPLKLGILVASRDPVIETFVRIKARAAQALSVDLVRFDIPEESSTMETLSAAQSLVVATDGIIVQLPLPAQLDIEAILCAIPNERDVDAINPRIAYEEEIVHAPVAGALAEILAHHKVATKGKRAIIVGAGRLVGAPCAKLLEHLGADVSIITKENGSLNELKSADIIVLGAGDPGFVKPNMIKKDVVLIDAGTSEAGGKIKGDADPACAEKCSLFTPVPGGVGPIAVAMIFKNLFDLARVPVK
jgi:methylenetetrahydrofolate dehydrogenase (NADP+)/methenyltetrahydrofolate cyclohydrolase